MQAGPQGDAAPLALGVPNCLTAQWKHRQVVWPRLQGRAFQAGELSGEKPPSVLSALLAPANGMPARSPVGTLTNICWRMRWAQHRSTGQDAVWKLPPTTPTVSFSPQHALASAPIQHLPTGIPRPGREAQGRGNALESPTASVAGPHSPGNDTCWLSEDQDTQGNL